MKSYYFILLALLCFVIAALAQENPIGEEPDRPIGEEPSGDESQASSSEGTMCIALALLCADGSYATQDKNCHYICGDAPTGGRNYSDVLRIMDEFLDAYPEVMGTSISTLYGKDFGVVISPPESLDDYCLEVMIPSLNHMGYPDVYQGVRVWYVQSTPYCSPKVCADGTVVGCNDYCYTDSDYVASSSSIFTPITIIVVVVVLSACFCCIRRRKCRAKCQMKGTPLAPQPCVPQEQMYPAEQYALLQQQQEQFEQEQAQSYAIPMHPVYPPMPMIPPQMMMMPNNGQYIMMQAPNGMWYPVVAPQQHETL